MTVGSTSAKVTDNTVLDMSAHWVSTDPTALCRHDGRLTKKANMKQCRNNWRVHKGQVPCELSTVALSVLKERTPKMIGHHATEVAVPTQHLCISGFTQTLMVLKAIPKSQKISDKKLSDLKHFRSFTTLMSQQNPKSSTYVSALCHKTHSCLTKTVLTRFRQFSTVWHRNNAHKNGVERVSNALTHG